MYRRAAALAAVLFLWLLLGPVVLLLLVVALAVPRSRWWIVDNIRPERPWRATGIAAGVLVALSLLVIVIHAAFGLGTAIFFRLVPHLAARRWLAPRG